jgi:uncharacterized protein (UPF0264 family)
MKILISPVSLDEARAVVSGGGDIVDVKNVKEGSLGAQKPWIVESIVAECRKAGSRCSAALGDLPYKPGTAALAAFGAAQLGVDYIKAGLFGVKDYDEALDLMSSVVRAIRMKGGEPISAVAAGYADFKRFGGISYHDVVRVAADSGADLAMLDTAVKDGRTLFDALTCEEIEEFVTLARESGLQVALAGSVNADHMPALREIRPDIVGIRGAVCPDGDRTLGITEEAVRAFMASAK